MKKLAIAAAMPVFALAASAFTLAPNASASSACHSSSGLPDRHCTPGATWSRVTQGNIHSTICKLGWTATIRPSESYTEALKRTQLRLYGDYAGSELSNYEEDHLIPLELAAARRQHAISGRKRTLLRTPRMESRPPEPRGVQRAGQAGSAQRAIASDWKTAEHVLGLR